MNAMRSRASLILVAAWVAVFVVTKSVLLPAVAVMETETEMEMEAMMPPINTVRAASSARIVMEESVTPGQTRWWHSVGRSSLSAPLFFTLALTLSPEAAATLGRAFNEVSDPRLPTYGAFWSKDKVLSLLSPPLADVRKVTTFLIEHGASASSLQVTGNLITVSLTVAQAEQAFQTEFHKFTHKETGTLLHRASSHYSLPLDIAALVSTIDGILLLPRVHRLKLTPFRGDGAGMQSDLLHKRARNFPANTTCGGVCAGGLTPAILAERYKTGEAPTTCMPGNAMAVAEFQGENWDQADCDAFASACNIVTNITVAVQIGSNTPQDAGAEALLDIEYIKALGGGIPLTNIYAKDYGILDWAKAVAVMEKPPLVHSISYGLDEIQQPSQGYMEACNTQFQAIALRGVSVLVAAGDGGVCGRSGCSSNRELRDFHPDFPASSPFVTAVGGTILAQDGVIGDEITWPFGGGGFSNEFAIPAYQTESVAAYKSGPAKSSLPFQRLWNNTGRGYPDVSALAGGDNEYCISYQGSFYGVQGTSASTPVVAAMFARLNDLRLQASKPALGFLNPFIYQNPGAFNDITIGCNNATGPYGFTAAVGWDPATGLGTPDFAKLVQLI